MINIITKQMTTSIFSAFLTILHIEAIYFVIFKAAFVNTQGKMIITHADSSRVSKAIIRICVRFSLFVCSFAG